MTVRSELFVADHAAALAHADARDAHRAPTPGLESVELAGLDAIDLELLGEVAARAVQYGTGELELQEVDLDRESLFELPPFLREVFVELGRAEDAELAAEVATEWSSSADHEWRPAGALTVVRSIISLVTAATDAEGTVYLWVGATE
jgi:hypothetical protein